MMNARFAVFPLCLLAGVAVSEPRPNLILIVADDLGYADIGCYGGKLAPTPHLDALAAAGVRFTDAYATAPVCGPSRCGILTGAYGQRFGMQWNEDQHAKGNQYHIPDAHRLLPQALAESGYATGHIGKWNVSRPFSNAVEEAYCVMDWKGHYFADDEDLFVGVDGHGPQVNSAVEPHGWGPERPGAAYLTDTLTDRAVDFIRRHAPDTSRGDKPFFLYLAYNAVHSPWQAKRTESAKYAHLPNEPLRLYAAMVASLDENVGRVLQQLRDSGVENDTLVAFTSDNGPALGSARIKGWKEAWPKEVLMGSAAPLRGYKGQFYEGGIREPYILKWPARLKAGGVYRKPVSTMDLYATFCAAAQAPIPDGTTLNGVDLLPFLGGCTGAPHDALYWLANGQGAVRKGEWKLVVSPRKPQLALFNLADDEGESRDLAMEKPGLRDALHVEWLAWQKAFPPRSNPPPKKIRGAVTGVFTPKEMRAPAGATFTAFTVTTDDGHEHLIYYRLLKSKMPDGKWSAWSGKRVRVKGLREETPERSVFEAVDAVEVLGGNAPTVGNAQ